MNTTIQNATRSGVFNRTQKLIGALTVGALFVIPVLSPGAAKAALVTDLPVMSALTPFATFGNVYSDSAVTINGNVGISANGTLLLASPSTINGNLYLANGATATIKGSGTVTGTTFTGQNLTAAQNQVFSASTTLQNLTPDQSLGAVVVPGTGVTYGSVNGVADVTVINMTSLTTGGGDITFVGDAGDYFVLNIAGDLSMTGSAAIIGLSGHLLVNLWDPLGKNQGTVAHVGNVINGTTLIPYDSATFHSVDGAIYSGYGDITLMSDATVNYQPYVQPTPVPEPGTFIAGALLLLPFGASTLRILRRQATG